MPNLTSPAAHFQSDRLLAKQSFGALLKRSTLWLTVSLAVPLLILLGLITFLLRSLSLVENTNEVLAEARIVQRTVRTMQVGLEGFWILSEDRYLAPYRDAAPLLLPQVATLQTLVADNPRHTQTVRQLRREAEDWAALAEKHAETPPTASSSRAFLQAGSVSADRVIATLARFIEVEEDLRIKRSLRLQTIVITLFSVMAVAALLGLPLLINRVKRILRETNLAYQDSLTTCERRASEFHVTLKSIGDGVVATDCDGKVEFLNAVAERMTGWTSEEAVGRPLQEVFVILNEHTGQITESPVERVIRENSIVGLANRTVLRNRQGDEVPIEDSAAPIRNEDGDVLGVILVFHDVSEKKEAERARKKVEARAHFLNDLGEATRVLIDDASIMKVSTQKLGKFIQASRCAYAEVDPATLEFEILHDYTDNCASTTGKYHLSLFGPRAQADMTSGRTLVLRDVAAEVKAGEGAEMFAAIGINALICCPLVKEGKLRAMMAVHQVTTRDWTAEEIELVEEVVERCWATIERGRAESEATERAERFRLLSEVVSLQVWMADLEGNLSYVNEECVEYFGAASPMDILGAGWTGFVHPQDLPRVTEQWITCLRTGKGYEVEFRLQNQAGEYRWFIARAEIMRDAEGKPIQWFGSNTDIEDLKAAQGKAEEANRAKDAFLAALSHELRTPLTPVLMTASALRDDARLPGDVREQLNMMERNIVLEARLIDDLLDVTSIAQGKLQLRTEPCDAHALIKLAMEIVRPDADANEIYLECKFSAERSELQADPARFQQVIWNLLRNAVKFTPRRGKIFIQTRDKDDGHLCIEVTDSGMGIAPELLDQIFSPFEQGGLTGDHRFGGMGLGLAIARAILQVHGGTIRATSPGLGQGATFVVDIPGARAPSQTAVSTSTPQSLPVDRKPATPSDAKLRLRLLVIEDHESTLLVLTKMLTREGHSIVAVNSAAAALEAAARETFDLVISDLGLPDASGHDLMEQLRDRYGLRGIALSGYGMEDDLERSRNAGFILHLVKPVDFTRLRQALVSLEK